MARLLILLIVILSVGLQYAGYSDGWIEVTPLFLLSSLIIVAISIVVAIWWPSAATSQHARQRDRWYVRDPTRFNINTKGDAP